MKTLPWKPLKASLLGVGRLPGQEVLSPSESWLPGPILEAPLCCLDPVLRAGGAFHLPVFPSAVAKWSDQPLYPPLPWTLPLPFPPPKA